MSTLLTPGRAVKWIGDDGGWKTGKVLGTFVKVCTSPEWLLYVHSLDGVHCVEVKKLTALPLRSEYEAAE